MVRALLVHPTLPSDAQVVEVERLRWPTLPMADKPSASQFPPKSETCKGSLPLSVNKVDPAEPQSCNEPFIDSSTLRQPTSSIPRNHGSVHAVALFQPVFFVA